MQIQPTKRYIARDVDGILLLNKPKELSSNQALQKLKHLFQARKAGHTGSLDPLATGMLPICFGEAAKFSHFLLDADKVYYATAKLGIATSTGDAEGEIIETAALPTLTKELLNPVLQQFIGIIQQTPPMYSALKFQGQPLYKLARAGIEVERKIRTITIYDINLVEIKADTFSIVVHCSKGTYIRTLIEDIAKALHTVGFVQLLHRQAVFPFNNQPMYDLESITQLISLNEKDKLLLPVDAAVLSLPIIMLTIDNAKKMQCGQSVLLSDNYANEIFRLYTEGNTFLGVGEIKNHHQLYVKRLVV